MMLALGSEASAALGHRQERRAFLKQPNPKTITLATMPLLGSSCDSK